MPKTISIFKLAAGLLLLSAGLSRAQVANTPAIDVYDGFETTRLSKVWDTSRFVPGAVEMQTNIFRAGHSAAKITIRARDIFEAGINGSKDSERDELLEAKESDLEGKRSLRVFLQPFPPDKFSHRANAAGHRAVETGLSRRGQLSGRQPGGGRPLRFRRAQNHPSDRPASNNAF